MQEFSGVTADDFSEAYDLTMTEVPTMSHQRLGTIGETWRTLAVMAMTFFLFSHTTVVYAQPRCWTTVGSAGTVDEADLSLVALSVNHAAVRSATGTVDIRYNVVAVDGVFGGDQNQKTLTAKIADNGTAAQVIIRLRQLNISNGVVTLLAEINSNDFLPSPVAQKRAKNFNCGNPEFDFEKNIYYIEVQLIKTGPGGNPLIRAIQICRSNDPC